MPFWCNTWIKLAGIEGPCRLPDLSAAPTAAWHELLGAWDRPLPNLWAHPLKIRGHHAKRERLHTARLHLAESCAEAMTRRSPVLSHAGGGGRDLAVQHIRPWQIWRDSHESAGLLIKNITAPGQCHIEYHSFVQFLVGSGLCAGDLYNNPCHHPTKHVYTICTGEFSKALLADYSEPDSKGWDPHPAESAC